MKASQLAGSLMTLARAYGDRDVKASFFLEVNGVGSIQEVDFVQAITLKPDDGAAISVGVGKLCIQVPNIN